MVDPLKVSEASFQSQVMQLARIYGWRVVHHRPCLNQRGKWLTPSTGDSGFPDLVLARPHLGDFIVAELKANLGRLSDGQRVWLDTLLRAGVETYLWRPRDLPEIRKRLERKPA